MNITSEVLKLQLITHQTTQTTDEYLKFIELCAKNGITLLQLRDKHSRTGSLISYGREIQAILKPYKIPLVINDNVNLAMKLNADGIHLGQKDGNPHAARILLGPDKIIGVSIESLAQLEIANQSSAINYVAASSVFPSNTKNNLSTIWGINGLNGFCQKSKHPVVAIGGVNLNNLEQIISTKVAGVAIISAIHETADPKGYIQKLLHLIN